jgi:hypothetical protein
MELVPRLRDRTNGSSRSDYGNSMSVWHLRKVKELFYEKNEFEDEDSSLPGFSTLGSIIVSADSFAGVAIGFFWSL